MALALWPKPPIEVVQSFERRKEGRGPVGALIMWATYAVESLYYLEDLAQEKYADLSFIDAYSSDIKDIAHARWATSTCITSLDLCAAALGREYCNLTKSRELDLRNFDPKSSKNDITKRRAILPATALGWIDKVFSDGHYKEIHGARNPLTHARLNRMFYLNQPTKFIIRATGNSFTTIDLVTLSKNLAKDHVESFLALIEKLQILENVSNYFELITLKGQNCDSRLGSNKEIA